jgi:hypothetical protein
MGLGWRVNAYPSRQSTLRGSIWVQRGSVWVARGAIMGSKRARGLVLRMQEDSFTTEPGGIMEVPMLGFDLAWV